MTEIEQPIELLLIELSDIDTPIKSSLIYRLSGPSREDFKKLQTAWKEIPDSRRQILMKRMADTSINNYDVNFTKIARFALEDTDSTVRKHAIVALWEEQDSALLEKLTNMMLYDESLTVRAQAAQAIGRFVFAGELEEIPESDAEHAQQALLEVLDNVPDSSELYRRALESISFSSWDVVEELIHQASKSHITELVATATFAMGRSADNRWDDFVLKALQHSISEIRFEATRAAGELTIKDAIDDLIHLACEDDVEIRQAAIWSLGEIGGTQASNFLMELSDIEEDDYMLESIEDALNMAVLANGDFTTFILGSDDEDSV